MIADGANREDGCADVGECDGLAIGFLKCPAASSLFKYKRRRYSECMR